MLQAFPALEPRALPVQQQQQQQQNSVSPIWYAALQLLSIFALLLLLPLLLLP